MDWMVSFLFLTGTSTCFPFSPTNISFGKQPQEPKLVCTLFADNLPSDRKPQFLSVSTSSYFYLLTQRSLTSRNNCHTRVSMLRTPPLRERTSKERSESDKIPLERNMHISCGILLIAGGGEIHFYSLTLICAFVKSTGKICCVVSKFLVISLIPIRF